MLILAELVGLSMRVDTGVLRHRPGLPAEILGYLPQVGSALLAAIAALGLFLLRTSRTPVRASVRRPGARCLLVATHMLAFGVFAIATVGLMQGGAWSSRAVLWIVLWLVSGAAAAVLWCLAMIPATSWAALLRRSWPVIVAALVLGVVAWSAGSASNLLWQPLAEPTYALVTTILRGAGQEVVADPETSVLGTESFRVQVAPQCSGYEGIGLMTVFLGAYLWLFRRRLRFPQALLLLPLGVTLIWLANGVRIAALVLVGTHVSREIALGGFHSQVGWLIFIGLSLGLVILTQKFSFFAMDAGREAGRTDAADATADYLLPLLVLVATTMVTGAMSGTFDRFYPVRVVTTGVVLWLFWRRALTRERLHGWFSTGAVGIGVLVFGMWLGLEHVLGAAESLSPVGAWVRSIPVGWAVLWLVARVVGSVLVVPTAEELAFRGYLLRRLVARRFEQVDPRRFTWASFLISSVLFGALHGRWVAGILAGLAYAWAVYRRGRLIDAIVAHAVTNGLIAIWVLSTGAWSLW